MFWNLTAAELGQKRATFAAHEGGLWMSAAQHIWGGYYKITMRI